MVSRNGCGTLREKLKLKIDKIENLRGGGPPQSSTNQEPNVSPHTLANSLHEMSRDSEPRHDTHPGSNHESPMIV